MKRFTLILTLFLMAAMPMMAERVTPETARKVATTFLNNNGAKVAQLTDLSKAAGFPNLYIFNANPGFVVMSADDCVRPILGYSLTNVFVAEGMPENIKGWLQGYSDQIQDAIDNALNADASVRAEWQSLKNGRADKAPSDVVVGPLIETRWNQDDPYNNLCPSSSVTGCVATAMAQVMKYHNFPSHGIGSHSYVPESHPEYGTLTVDFNSTNYDWTHMTNTYGVSSTAEEQLAVATLMYSCGVSVDMNYSPSSSGAVTAWVADALKMYFGYSSDVRHLSRSEYSDSNWIAMLKADLDLHRPIQYHGNGSGGGHSFVCDGYNTDNYFHFNWGWGGYCDDYYVIDNLNPGPGGIGSGTNGIYNDNQGAILGVHPAVCTADVPTGLAKNQEGRTVTLNWTSATGAVSYNIYYNDIYVGNSASNSYVTTAPYGTHSYYVRSVDSSGELSLSSNIVTVNVPYQTPVVNDIQATLSGSDVNLSWTALAWCYPETPSATLTYGDGSLYNASSSKYWAHRYLSANIATYIGKVIYKVSFFVYDELGTYNCYVYKGSSQTSYNSDEIFVPETLITSKTIEVSNLNRWIDIDLDNLVTIDSEEIWVVINFPENGGGRYAATFSNYSSVNNYGDYWGKYTMGGGGETGFVQSGDRAYLIRTYLTDGTYTYHLYDNGVSVADNIDATSYVVSSPANNTAHQYTVKTKYYGGESAASNTAGLTLGEATLASLSLTANDKLILTEGSQLTVTGTISNANAANLVIEDGAQLVHNGGDVEATIQKNISAWSAKGGAGWHLIASPVDEVNIASTLATGTYDLYGYHEPTHHWLNYKKAEHASFFDDLKLRRGKGYLYAHEDAKVVSFAGSMKETDVNVAVPLSWESSNETLKGWNLVGNPYSCNAYSNVAYYVMNAAGNGFESKTVNDAIPPCTGIFVRATGGGQSVTFSTTAPSSSANNGYLNIALDETNTRGSIRQDNAIVSFNEGEELSKFVFNEENAEVYFTQSNEDYAIAYSDKQGLMSLNFKARHDGTYTLSFTADVISSEAKKSPLNEMFSYLHLIDKRTDSDIDLLAMPEYTFEAKASDNASRFTLVFNESGIASVSAEPFAYVSNGNIIINAATDKATLQMIDVTGRIVVSYTGDAIDHVSTSGMTPGVYVLRLVRGENIKTQKIVIE